MKLDAGSGLYIPAEPYTHHESITLATGSRFQGTSCSTTPGIGSEFYGTVTIAEEASNCVLSDMTIYGDLVIGPGVKYLNAWNLRIMGGGVKQGPRTWCNRFSLIWIMEPPGIGWDLSSLESTSNLNRYELCGVSDAKEWGWYGINHTALKLDTCWADRCKYGPMLFNNCHGTWDNCSYESNQWRLAPWLFECHGIVLNRWHQAPWVVTDGAVSLI